MALSLPHLLSFRGEERLERDAAGRHPVVLGVDADAIAIGRGPVPEHDPANAKARRCGKVLRRAAVVIDERRHERASPIATLV
jgi:hypothetical protein